MRELGVVLSLIGLVLLIAAIQGDRIHDQGKEIDALNVRVTIIERTIHSQR